MKNDTLIVIIRYLELILAVIVLTALLAPWAYMMLYAVLVRAWSGR